MEKFKSCPIARADKVEFKCEFPEPQSQSSFALSHAAHFHDDRTAWQILGQEIVLARVKVSLATLGKLAELGCVWEELRRHLH